MTALLAKLGLNLATGKNLWPLAAVLGALAALIGAALYATHHYTAIGYDKAMAECRAAATAANDKRAEAETQLREANRDVLIRHVAEKTRVEQSVPTQKQEVADHAKEQPEIRLCALNERGLQLWNADPVVPAGPPLQVRPGTESPERAQPPGRPGGRHGEPDAEPRGLKGRLQGALHQASGSDGPGGGLRALSGSAFGHRIGIAYFEAY